MVGQVVAHLFTPRHAVGDEKISLLPAAHPERVTETGGIDLGDVFGHAEVLDRVDVPLLEEEHRVAAVAAERPLGNERQTGVVGRNRHHLDFAPIHIGDPVAGVETTPGVTLFDRMAEAVDRIALEAVSRTEQLVDDEPQRKRPVDAIDVDRLDAVALGDDLLADAFDAVVDEALGVAQAVDVAPHQVGELGVDLPDAGHQPEPDFVAQVFGRAVGGVLAERDAVGYGIFEDVPPRGEHQGADDPPDLGADAGQPPQPRAAQQVDEESFDRVVGVVRDRDERIAVLAAEGVEPTITEAPGRHLDRLARALDLGHRVEAAVVEGYAPAFRLALYERFVLFAFAAPKLEVAVGDTHAVAAVHEQREHDHRIHAARDGQQNTVVGSRQFMPGHITPESFEQVHN